MNLELHNSWEYKGDDWWEWSAFLKGSALSSVDYVEYILHPSFKKPLQKIKNPAGGFLLETSGWGVFDLKAIVHYKNGEESLLSRKIQLEYEPEKGSTDTGESPSLAGISVQKK